MKPHLLAFVAFSVAVLIASVSVCPGQGTSELAVVLATGQNATQIQGLPQPRHATFSSMAADGEGTDFVIVSNVAGIGGITQGVWLSTPRFGTEPSSHSLFAQLCGSVPGQPEPAFFGPFDYRTTIRNNQALVRNDLWTCGQGPIVNPAALFGGRFPNLFAREGGVAFVQSVPNALLLGAIGLAAQTTSSSAIFFSDYGTVASGVLGRGAFVSGSGGPAQVMSFIGAPVTNAFPGTVIASFDEPSLRAEFDGVVRVTLSGGGTSLETDSAIARLMRSGGPTQLAVREGTAVIAPGVGGATLGEIVRVVAGVSFGQQLYFIANLRGSGVTLENDTALFVSSGNSALLLAREGLSAPGLPADVVYRDFGSAASGPVPSLVFGASLAGPGVSSSNDEAILFMPFANPGQRVRIVAREGDAAPGTGVGFGPLLSSAASSLTFSGVTSLQSAPYAFRALLAGPGVDATNDGALFLAVGASLVPVIREGQTIATAPGVNRIVSRFSFDTNASPREGRRTLLSREGNAGIIAEFTDGTEAVIAARLTTACPSVLREPTAMTTVRPGRSFAISATISGITSVQHQWSRGGVPLVEGVDGTVGTRSASLSVSGARPIHHGEYTLTSSNACGSVSTQAARVVVPCVADYDDGTGSGTPDGGVTIEDLLYYLGLFELGAEIADVDDGSGTDTLDNGVTIEDLLHYLARFAAGC